MDRGAWWATVRGVAKSHSWAQHGIASIVYVCINPNCTPRLPRSVSIRLFRGWARLYWGKGRTQEPLGTPYRFPTPLLASLSPSAVLLSPSKTSGFTRASGSTSVWGTKVPAGVTVSVW